MSVFTGINYRDIRFIFSTYIATAKGRAYPYIRDSQYLSFLGERFDESKKLRLFKKPYPMNISLPNQITLPPIPPVTKGILRDEVKCVLNLINRQHPLLINGVLDHWREYLAGDFSMDGLCDFFLDERVGLNVCIHGNEMKAAPRDIRDKYWKAAYGAVTDDEPIMIYDKLAPVKFRINFPNIWIFPEDLFCQLFEDQRPTSQILQIEPYRAGLPIKRTRFGQDYWSALTEGKKLWICFPPRITREELGVVNPHRGGNEWFHNVYLNDLLEIPGRLEFIQEPGQVVYIPHHWWFKWISLADSNTSISKYFVDRVNIRCSWYDMGGSLPELFDDTKGYNIDTIQDPYAENKDTSATRQLSPLGIRSSLWPYWKKYLLDAKINKQLRSDNVQEKDFWATTNGLCLTYLDDQY